MADWMPYDKWRAATVAAMGDICGQNDLPAGDWPHIPDIRGRGFDPMGAAFYLLDNAGRLALARQWWLILYEHEDGGLVFVKAVQAASPRMAVQKAKALMSPTDLSLLNSGHGGVCAIFGPFDREPKQWRADEGPIY